jgi:hypothetical protein
MAKSLTIEAIELPENRQPKCCVERELFRIHLHVSCHSYDALTT